MNIDLICQELKQYALPDRALRDKVYHKSEREHWGIPAAGSDQVARLLAKRIPEAQLLQLATDLWNTNLFDSMICAAKLLALLAVRPSRALWKTITEFLGVVDGWALEDTLAHAAWKCLLADENLLDEVAVWTKHPNFWMRRAALVYTLPFAKSGRDPERMLEWASSYASDPEWFIQKAIGWWLRVLGEHNPTRVRAFLQVHWDELKFVARKEATRKLT